MKISQKTIFFTSFLTLITIVLVFISLFLSHLDNSKKALLQDNLELAEMCANYFDAQLDKTGVLLTALETMPAIQEHNPTEATQLLKNVYLKYPFITAIFAADKNGNVFADTNPQRLRRNLKEEPYIKKALSGSGMVISSKTLSLRSGKPVIRIAFPIKNNKGEITGCLGAVIPLENFQKNLNIIGYQKESSIILIDQNNNLLAATNNLDQKIKSLDKLKLKYLKNRLKGGTEAFNPYTTEMEIFAFVPMSQSHWGILVTEPLSHINASLRRDFYYNAPMDFLLIVPFLTYIYLTNRRLKAQQKELQETNTHLEQLSYTDNLTGLHNNRYFYEEIHKELERCKRFNLPMALLILDIDDFKHYNDTNGHLKGDNVLKEFGQILHNSVRNVDTVARYGGEEFVLMLVEIEQDEAIVAAQRILQGISSYKFEGGEKQPGGCITASLGIAIFPEHGADANQLIEIADKALYKAKQKKNSIVLASIEPQQLELTI